MRRFLPLFLAALVAAPCVARAGEDYRIDWYTLDGGGGTSTSADQSYSLSGTIGQPDAEVVSLCSADGGAGCVNATYELTGGFWAGISAPSGGGGSGSCGAQLNCVFRDGFEAG
jgi:hypothetical protein